MSTESRKRFSTHRTWRSWHLTLHRSTLPIVLLALPVPTAARAQRSDSGVVSGADTAAKDKWPSKFQLHWNEYNFGFMTFRVGAAWLTDYASFNQDSLSETQFQP